MVQEGNLFSLSLQNKRHKDEKIFDAKHKKVK